MTDADVVVIGAGIGGLVIAHDLARAGVRVIVCEASDHVGGLLRRGTLAGIDVDLGAESFATRTDAVASLVAELALDSPALELTEPRPGGAFLAVATEDGPVRAPLPRRTVLGIPADPLAADVVALVGADAAARAAHEIDLPAWTRPAGDEPSLFDLVAERCGPVVAERLVDTLCRSVYSRPASELRLSELHPGMWRALQAHGSLTAAAAELAGAGRAGAAVGGISGGMWLLPAALAGAARAHGAEIRTGTPVHEITGAADTALAVHTTGGGTLTARCVVVATGPAEAVRLRARPGPANATGTSEPDAAGRVRVVVAAIDNTALDVFPVGSGIIVDPALAGAAKALTHVTAKWPWADAAAPAGRHIVRLSARDADIGGLDTAGDIAREVTLLTGVEVEAADIVDIIVTDWADAVPAEDGGAVADAARRGILQAGAAAAGTGLASVIPHARRLAARLITDLTLAPDTPPAAVNDSTHRPTRSIA